VLIASDERNAIASINDASPNPMNRQVTKDHMDRVKAELVPVAIGRWPFLLAAVIAPVKKGMNHCD